MEDDLTWLARNVHEWEQGCHYLVKTLDNGCNWIVGEMVCRDNAANYYTRDQWLQRRAELQNKPNWDEAPEWASTMSQQANGDWILFESYHPKILAIGGKAEWSTHSCGGRYSYARDRGEVLGDWRNTLEERQEKRELNPPTSSLTNAQAVEIAKEIGICSDGLPCEPCENGADQYCDDCPNNPCNCYGCTDGDDEVVIPPPPEYDPADVAFDFIETHGPNAYITRPEQTLEMAGRKADANKPRMDLIPPKAEKLLAEVLSYGAQKYAPNNWKHVPDAHDRYIAAAMRHINSHRSGEEIDPESGLPHLAHAMCSLAFILELEA